MKLYSLKKMLSLIACIVLIAAMALCTTGCGNSEPIEQPDIAQLPAQVVGEGETVFYFVAVDLEGVSTKYEVHTNETTVGAALTALGLISGDMGDYGLYIKTVNGITLDWDTHGKYWALYIGDEYGLTGIDMVDIVADTVYTLRPES